MTDTQPKHLVSQRAELKPCPFCGGEALDETFVIEAQVRCSVCAAKIVRKHGSDDEAGHEAAIAAWNRRPAETLASLSSEKSFRCPTSDDTGDVHRIDGEWLGECDCGVTEADRAAYDAATNAYASYMGDPDGKDDFTAANEAAAKVIALHRQQALSEEFDRLASTPSPSDVIEKCDGEESEIEALRHTLRMIVSHATGGSSQDIDASVNDICVAITRHVNRVWQAAQESALASKEGQHHGQG